MKEYYNTNKTFIITVVIIFIVIVGVAIYYYRKGKKTTSIVDPNLLPGGDGTGTTGASNDEIKIVATGLYDDMKGWNALGHKDEFYKRALFFNDRDLAKLYNTFNALYQSNTNETLTMFLQHEYFASDEPYGPLLKEKLLKLNLV